MRALEPTTGEVAIIPTFQADSRKSLTVQTDSEDNSWFKIPARVLLGSDPGLALHVLTGVSESSGRRYAGGERVIPGNLLRDLQRGPQGRQWTAAVLDGAPWWVEFMRVHDIGTQVLQITKR